MCVCVCVRVCVCVCEVMYACKYYGNADNVLTNVFRSSKPPMCLSLKNICGTVRRPVFSCISYRLSG